MVVRGWSRGLGRSGSARGFAIIVWLVTLAIATLGFTVSTSQKASESAGIAVRYSVTIPDPPASRIQVIAEYSQVSSPLVLDLGFETYRTAINDILAGLSFATPDGAQVTHTLIDHRTVKVELPPGQDAVTGSYEIDLSRANPRATGLREMGAKVSGYEGFLVPRGQRIASVRVRFDVPQPWQVVSVYPSEGEWFSVTPVTFEDLGLETRSSGFVMGIVDFDQTRTYDDGHEIRVVGFKNAIWRHWNLDSGGSPLEAALESADFCHATYVALKELFGDYPYQRQLLTGPDFWWAGTTQAMSLIEPPWQYESYCHHMVHTYFGPCEAGGKTALGGAFSRALAEGYTTYCEGFLTSRLTGDPISQGMLYERKMQYLRAGHFNNLEQDASSYVYGLIRTCAIDQQMRKVTGGAKGIDDLMVALWRKYRTSGFAWINDDQVLSTLRELTGSDWTSFYRQVIQSNALDASVLEPLRQDFGAFLDAIAERWYYGHPSAYFVSQEIVSSVGNLTLGVRFQDPTMLDGGDKPISVFAAEARRRYDLYDLSMVLSEEQIEDILHTLTGKDHTDFFEFFRGLGFTLDPVDITEYVRSCDNTNFSVNQSVRATPQTVIAGQPTRIRLDILDDNVSRPDTLILQVETFIRLTGDSLPSSVSGFASGPGVSFMQAREVGEAPGTPVHAHFELPIMVEGQGASERMFTEFTLRIPPEAPLTCISLFGKRDGSSSSGYIGTHKVNFEDWISLDVVPRRFTDLESENQFLSDIDYLASKRIVSAGSDGCFRPLADITRAELAEWLVKAAGSALDVPAPGFPDVPPTHSSYRYIAAAKASGIIRGYDDGTFKPDNPVSRAEMAAMIVRAFELPQVSEGSVLSPFADVSPEHGLAREIYSMAAAGIARGYPDGTFRPEQHTPREQAAAFVARACRRTAPWAMVGRQP